MTTQATDVEARVRRVIVESLGVDESEVVPTAQLGLNLGADSLDVVEIAIDLEREFGVEISDDAFDGSSRTVGDVVALISTLVRS